MKKCPEQIVDIVPPILLPAVLGEAQTGPLQLVAKILFMFVLMLMFMFGSCGSQLVAIFLFCFSFASLLLLFFFCFSVLSLFSSCSYLCVDDCIRHHLALAHVFNVMSHPAPAARGLEGRKRKEKKSYFILYVN